MNECMEIHSFFHSPVKGFLHVNIDSCMLITAAVLANETMGVLFWIFWLALTCKMGVDEQWRTLHCLQKLRLKLTEKVGR
jgi:thiamine kinase-like enzyme